MYCRQSSLIAITGIIAASITILGITNLLVKGNAQSSAEFTNEDTSIKVGIKKFQLPNTSCSLGEHNRLICNK